MISFNSVIYRGGEKPLVAGCVVLMIGVLKDVQFNVSVDY